jgi:1,2-diacylglycerol 3-alpha-glucosyltransferase
MMRLFKYGVLDIVVSCRERLSLLQLRVLNVSKIRNFKNKTLKMNILVVSQFNKHSKNGGGESVVTFQQVKSLVEYGHKVAVVTHGHANEVLFDLDMGVTFIFAQTLGEPPFGYMPLSKKQFEFLESSINDFQPDVIHSHTMNYLALMVQGFALKHNFKFLYTTHELPDKLVHFFRYGKTLQSLTFFFVNTLVKAFLTNTDKVLAINKASKESTLRLNFQGQVDIIHNGVEIKLFNHLVEQFPNEKVNLFFVGGVNDRKNQYFLIHVLKYLPKTFFLHLIGEPDKNYQLKLDNLINEHGLVENTFFVGNVDNQALPKVIQDYHVFVSASKMEVQSVAVIEALAAAKPIVALKNETIEEIAIHDCVTMLPQDTSPEEFAKSILEMVEDKNRYLRRAKEAREISKNFTKETAYEMNVRSYETTEISSARNNNVYKASVLVYILGVGSLYRIKKSLNQFGLWNS